MICGLIILYSWAIHNGANWKDDGAKKCYHEAAKKKINGDNLPVFSSEVNGANPVLVFSLEVSGANPVFYLYFHLLTDLMGLILYFTCIFINSLT